MSVFVLDRNKRPLDPCSEKRARQLLKKGRARVHRLVPFVIRLVDRKVEDSVVHDHTTRIDPGSKTTGIALVRKIGTQDEAGPDVRVLKLIHLEHRGMAIRNAMLGRKAHRRFRRSRLRYRAPRFDNRARREGWLAPSLKHRVDTTLSMVARLRRWAPVTSVDMELVRFDTQLMENPEISGVVYQQGELQGYEVREYLLEKWHRKCAYCGAKDVPLQIEHVVPRSRGGSDRVSNLTLACEPCNVEKGARPVEEFLAGRTATLKKIIAGLKAPLRDAAAVNTTRWALFRALEATGLPLATGTGGRTKWNRSRLGVPKTHALDAACVGVTGSVAGWRVPTLVLRAMGRGSYGRTRLDKHGFPRGYLIRSKSIFGFATGDLVVADVPIGKGAGRHVGRIAIRASGQFAITGFDGVKHDVRYRYCRLLQRGDGYSVGRLFAPDPETKKGRVSARS